MRLQCVGSSSRLLYKVALSSGTDFFYLNFFAAFSSYIVGLYFLVELHSLSLIMLCSGQVASRGLLYRLRSQGLIGS